MTAPARLGLLLPWVNAAPPVPVGTVRRHLRAFAESFDGSAEVGHLRSHGTPAHEISQATPAALEALRTRLRELLRRGFPPNIDVKDGQWINDQPWGQTFPLMQAFSSLRFGVICMGRPAPRKLVRASSHERRTFRAPGAYTLLVEGDLADLVLFFVAHLLTAPGMAVVSRCAAPAPNNWEARCHRFIVGSGVGRPPECCSGACRVRAHAERLRTLEREATGRKKRKGKR